MGSFKGVLRILLGAGLFYSCTPPLSMGKEASPSVQLPSLDEALDASGQDSLGVLSHENSYKGRLARIQQAAIDEAIECYQQYYAETESHDLELLRALSLRILEEGSRGEPEEQLLSLFGAGVSIHEQLLPLLARALHSPSPQVQLAALQFLARYQDSRANTAIHRAMGSRFLSTRLEAVYHLARIHYPTAFGQINALMAKVPAPLLPLFPQLYAQLGTEEAMGRLRHLMMAKAYTVRVAAVLSAAQKRHDILLPQIRSLATQLHPAQREACAMALGHMGDRSSLDLLEKMAVSQSDRTAHLAALKALYDLGQFERREEIEELALQREIYAIQVLAEVEGAEQTLASLLHDKELKVRFNAATALLKRRDPRALPVLREVLFQDSRDLALAQARSWGGCFTAWRLVPSAKQNLDPMAYELAMRHKSALLVDCMENLPSQHFLEIAEELLARQERPLIPLTVRLLENEQSAEALRLLKRYAQRVGAPLTRQACQLALFRLGEPGRYREWVSEWVSEQAERALISLAPVLPWEVHRQNAPYELSPSEESRLLFEGLDALAQQQDADSIALLVEMLSRGNPKNRPAIAGLLLRSSL